MQPQEYYQEILSRITDDLQKQVFDVLGARLGEAVLRTELIEIIFGDHVESSELENNPHDRAIRECIEALRSKDFPIISSSSKAGYCLSDDEEAIERCVAEYRSRTSHMQERITHLLRSKSVAHDLHQWRRGTELPMQARMF